MKYEVYYIIRSDASEEVMKQVMDDMINAYTSNGATILQTKEPELKDFAYEINGMRKGYYVWFEVEANAQAGKEFTRRANINEQIVRHIVVKED